MGLKRASNKQDMYTAKETQVKHLQQNRHPFRFTCRFLLSSSWMCSSLTLRSNLCVRMHSSIFLFLQHVCAQILIVCQFTVLSLRVLRERVRQSLLRACMNASVHVKFTLGKEMMPDDFNGMDHVIFSDFLSAGDNEHAGDIMEWIRNSQAKCLWTSSTRSRCSDDGQDKQETASGLPFACSLY